jgi:NADH-quinone oxidoreductase subunit E
METTAVPQKFEKVLEILEKNGNNPARLIPILQQIQDEYRYLPEEIMTFAATSLGISPAKVFGVATFYSHFAMRAKGKYVIKICDGTACHVKKSTAILEAIQKKLGLSEGKQTDDALLFTLETVSCLGACGLAPAVVINEDVHGLMTPAATEALIDEIIKSEVQK